jgi:hypothetical protein
VESTRWELHPCEDKLELVRDVLLTSTINGSTVSPIKNIDVQDLGRGSTFRKKTRRRTLAQQVDRAFVLSQRKRNNINARRANRGMCVGKRDQEGLQCQ